MKFQWLVLPTVVLTLASVGRCDDAEKDGKALEGTWVPLSAELSGKKFPDEVLKTMKLVLTALLFWIGAKWFGQHFAPLILTSIACLAMNWVMVAVTKSW